MKGETNGTQAAVIVFVFLFDFAKDGVFCRECVGFGRVDEFLLFEVGQVFALSFKNYDFGFEVDVLFVETGEVWSGR